MPLKDKQIETIEESIKKLNEMKSTIESGGGDAKVMSSEFTGVITDVNSAISELLKEIKEGLDEKITENNKSVKPTMKPCGIMDRQPKYSQADVVTAQGAVEDIVAEIKSNPMDYSKLKEITKGGKAGTGIGSEKATIKILEIVSEPWWIGELETELNLFKRRGKTKSYYDPLELMRGVPSKEREKKLIKERTLWLLLDVSGSMFSYSYKGRSILELLASYIPIIAKDFEGELWQIDYGVPNKVIKLEDLREDQIKTMPITGGGGTDFDEVFKQLQKKKAKLEEETGGEAEFMTVLFTDAEVQWNQNLMPKNLFIVTVPANESDLPPLDEEKNQRAIIIDIDSDEADED